MLYLIGPSYVPHRRSVKETGVAKSEAGAMTADFIDESHISAQKGTREKNFWLAMLARLGSIVPSRKKLTRPLVKEGEIE